MQTAGDVNALDLVVQKQLELLAGGRLTDAQWLPRIQRRQRAIDEEGHGRAGVEHEHTRRSVHAGIDQDVSIRQPEWEQYTAAGGDKGVQDRAILGRVHGRGRGRALAEGSSDGQ